MFTIFGFGADLRREMSTKSNGNPAAWGSAAGSWGRTLVSDIGILQRARMELAYFSGYFRLKQRQTGGAGVILRFERVRPRRADRFQPNQWREITPQFLDRTIRALKRWKFDLVSMDEVCRRAVTLPAPNRFASLTFDGGCKDVIASAYPVLSKHGVPFTVYLPTAFPDGIGEAWWLALEDMIAREERISLMIDRKERRFATGSVSEKYDTFEFLANWMRILPPPGSSGSTAGMPCRCLTGLKERPSMGRGGFSRSMPTSFEASAPSMRRSRSRTPPRSAPTTAP